MKPVLVLTHGDDIPLGLLGEALDDGGLEFVETPLHDGAEIPPLHGFGSLVVMGGVMGAYDEPAHPWLIAEKRTIAQAYETGMPMLGICLGCQLFADALGGRAFLAEPPPEIGHFAPRLTAAGTADPVLRHFDEPVIVFHEDTWDLPPQAILLAVSDRFNHAFRLGTAVGIQAHPEADAGIVAAWVAMDEERPLLEAAGVDPEVLVAEVEAGEVAQREMARRLFGAWITEARSRLLDA